MVDWAKNEGPQPDSFANHTKKQSQYKSRSDFIESNKLDLNREYRAIDLINLLRGKTFMLDSNNLFVIDPATGKRIYINVCLFVGE
jgi:hypothetical protein